MIVSALVFLYIDEQHKELIKLLNRMIDYKDVIVDSETISETLNGMNNYAQYHFQTEEQYMTNYNYPDYSSHKKEHDEFNKQTALFCVDTMKHKDTIPNEILSFLMNWLTNHILKTDMKYKLFFNEKGLS